MRIIFTVPGDPKAKARPRATVIGGHASMYTPKKTARWESIIRETAIPKFPDGPIPAGEPVHMSVKFWFPFVGTPRKREPHPAQWLPKREDVDNLFKLVADSLNGIAYVDDRQIVEAHIQKIRCGQNRNEPRTEVMIETKGDRPYAPEAAEVR